MRYRCETNRKNKMFWPRWCATYVKRSATWNIRLSSSRGEGRLDGVVAFFRHRGFCLYRSSTCSIDRPSSSLDAMPIIGFGRDQFLGIWQLIQHVSSLHGRHHHHHQQQQHHWWNQQQHHDSSIIDGIISSISSSISGISNSRAQIVSSAIVLWLGK